MNKDGKRDAVPLSHKASNAKTIGSHPFKLLALVDQAIQPVTLKKSSSLSNATYGSGQNAYDNSECC